MSLVGLGKVPSWAGWGAMSGVAALPPVVALCVAERLVLMLTSPCAV